MRRCRGAGLAGLAAVLLVTAGRTQVQQEPSAETTEGTGINITCSHPNIQTGMFIHWYRQLPGRGPAFLLIANAVQGTKPVPDPPGRLWVAADRRSSALWLARPQRGDAAVYYCAVGDTGRGAGAAAGHEPRSRNGGGRGRASVGLFLIIMSSYANCLVKNTIMTKKVYFLAVLGGCAVGFVVILSQVALLLLQPPFCTKKVVDHFYCHAGPA
ncbi:uncharacterized protein LOC129195257 [Grus americana]|uniref:uncharacterized protein LOC129195257 n=1 Tax=Grus americana TaxID=9117 RepID=UPI002407CD33|nr:uncharacterized protein LOC129195257 [Grus americana]